MDVRSVSLYNVYSGCGCSENVARWTRAKKEGLGKKLVPFAIMSFEGVTAGKFFENIVVNMCNVLQFVGEIRIYGVQDKSVHVMEI